MKIFLSIILVCFVIVFSSLSAQNSPALTQIAKVRNGGDWVKFKPDVNIKANDLFSVYAPSFGLRNGLDKMLLIHQETDKLNFSHLKYQQFYKDIPVEGAQYILHESYGNVKTCNGKLVKGLSHAVNPALNATEAIAKALAFVHASKYKWQDKDAENLLKQIKNDTSATYYPKPELVLADKKFGKDPLKYRLVYKMEVYAVNPFGKLLIYVDAMTGEIYHSINMIINIDKPGTALTIYDGNQSVTIDSVAPTIYRLREYGRGQGIITFNLRNQIDHSAAIDIRSTSTTFTADLAGNEAHWASEMTYDYYFKKFGRNSYDDAGAPLISYVHYSTNYINAFWDGTAMSYGDGGSGYGAFTTLDVCGHEITHAVSGATAGFVYQDESGALSESFSDIFGTAIEHSAVLFPNWNIGEDISSQPLRSMSNPKLYQQPTTYKKQYWEFGSDDNGGVHTNCSIGNYWFYMLCLGAKGTNEDGFKYDVKGIGMAKAEKIAYRTMTVYLTSNSNFIDAYFASLEAARDLFGQCSDELKQTAMAWAAVGVGFPLSNQDVYVADIVSPATACGLYYEKVSLNLYFAGCDSVLKPGDKIVLAYKLDSRPKVYDTLTLSNDWKGGDSLAFSFRTPVDASKLGNHNLSCWAKLGSKTVKFNDSIINYQFRTILHQNIDVGAVRAVAPFSGCGLTDKEPVKFKYSFFGCDSLSAGETIAFSFKVNDNTAVTENYVLPSTMRPHDTLIYVFKGLADLSKAFGKVKIQYSAKFAKDSFNLNDTVSFYVTHPISLKKTTVTFDEKNQTELYFVNTTVASNAYASTVARHAGARGFLMTGGNAMDYVSKLQFPNDTNVWMINDFLSAKISFCVDATAWKSVNMTFELKQTNGGATYEMLLGPGDYTRASSMRILANGTQIGGTYNPVSYSSDLWKTYNINLNAYANTNFVATFESRCFMKDTIYSGYPLKMDNVYLENVTFNEYPEESINEVAGSAFFAALYPSLANDWYAVNMSSDASQDIRFEVYDLYGKLVKTSIHHAVAGKNKFIFNSSDMTEGIYLVRLTGKSNTTTLRMVKQ